MLKRMIKEVKREPWSLRTVWISSLERNVIIMKRILFLKKESDDHLLCNVTVCYTLVNEGVEMAAAYHGVISTVRQRGK